MNATPDNFAHMVLTCPPYGDIEKYESVTGQLSDIKDYKKFCDRIQVCGDNIERVLVPAGFVYGYVETGEEIGQYRPFHSDCINMFTKSGLNYMTL